MIFYHYTSEPHLEQIQEDGVINTSDSNVSATTEHAGPDVVWLFKEPLTGPTPRMLISNIDVKIGMLSLDKSKIQIEVDVPEHEVRRADKFFKKLGADPQWIKQLEESGQSKNKKWYVIQRNIPQGEWRDVSIRPEASDILEDYTTGTKQRIGHVEGTFVFDKKVS
jgi:hypothetical protein|tara:strand:+ start:3678 stop:4175 length:498 start_codon:yes stop_codon:yes gene_type:complete